MDNMLLDLGQCLTAKLIGISIRVYKFLSRIDRYSMEFISRLINLITIFGNNFLFDDAFFFSVTRSPSPMLKNILRYVINIAWTAK